MSIQRVVKRASSLVDAIVTPPRGITILIYHRVGGGTDGAVDLDRDVFRRQLQQLATDHTVIDLDTAVASLDGSGPVESAVVMTFDDGTHDFCDVVVPELVEVGLPATLYVATGFVDGEVPSPWGVESVSWAGLRDAVSTGLVTIGSHSHTHRLFDRIDPATARDEIERSVGAIGDQLELPVAHFAYPKALAATGDVDAEIRRSFASAALTRSRVNRPGRTDPHRLARTPVQRTDGSAEFTAKARGGMRLEGELRELAARRRYRHADS